MATQHQFPTAEALQWGVKSKNIVFQKRNVSIFRLEINIVTCPSSHQPCLGLLLTQAQHAMHTMPVE